MRDLRLDQVDSMRAAGEFVGIALIVVGLLAAVFLVSEVMSQAGQLRRMGVSVGFMGIVAAALPGLGMALGGLWLVMMANLLRIGIVIAERLSPDRTREAEGGRPAAG